MIKIYSWAEFPRRIQPSICRFIFPRAISRSIVRRHRRDDLHTGLILKLRREEEEEDSRLLLLLLLLLLGDLFWLIESDVNRLNSTFNLPGRREEDRCPLDTDYRIGSRLLGAERFDPMTPLCHW